MVKGNSIYSGEKFKDNRGELIAFNSFDMSRVSRMYMIEPNPEIIRAWQGHREETKWFFVVKGSFEIRSIEATDANNIFLENREKYILTEHDYQVLEVPGGNLNGFRALQPGSCLQVFSEFDLIKSKADDFRIDLSLLPWV